MCSARRSKPNSCERCKSTPSKSTISPSSWTGTDGLRGAVTSPPDWAIALEKKLERVLDWVLELKIPWFTVYALSTENLNRPQGELDVLFDLYVEGLKDIADDERIHDNNVRRNIIGRQELLPEQVNEAIDYAESRTADYDDFVFTVCLAYGSREEMITAIQTIAKDYAAGDISLDDIDQDAVSRRLYTADMPDPDLVIRTSVEERISNF